MDDITKPILGPCLPQTETLTMNGGAAKRLTGFLTVSEKTNATEIDSVEVRSGLRFSLSEMICRKKRSALLSE